MRKTVTLLTCLALILVFVLGSVTAQDQTIVEIASANEDFSTLVTAVEAAGLVDVLNDPEAEWTVFAPTNDAFAALPEGVLDMLLADTELLTRVLTYHVVEGTVTSDMLSDMMAPSMEMTAPGEPLMGSELQVTIGEDGTVMVNDATVVMADILASNGVIHVIDTVLVPEEIGMMLMQGDSTEEPMMDDMMMGMGMLYASLNPAELADDAIVSVGSDMMEMTSTFDGFEGITSVQSVKFTSDGTAYITVDVAEGEGGILIVEGLASAESMAVGMGTRMIGGSESAGLVSPKGLEIIESLDLVLVANFGAPNIKGFSLSDSGDVTPAVFIDNFGGVGGSVWDIHYDEETDTLFAAGTTGTLLVYSAFSENLGADGPTSTIVPSDADGNQISVNLHGVDYDAASDTVVLSDVGSADDATDGQLFAITNASMASGNTPVDVQIGGPESMLGNPVDVVWDGTGLYVAEKSNDGIFYYPDFLSTMGMMDMAAPTVIDALKPESVTLFGDAMMMEDEM
ncbi:MAG: hypothetical protein OHK0046_27480 [Anaerolineae bacterium]